MKAARALRSVLPALLVLTGATQATAQTFRVVTFGDSLTEAYPFDLGSGSSCTANRDTCGYTARLASAYGCGSGDCSFTNRGRSGELTTSGLTRLDQVLRERDWDLLVLLEGTNDIAAGISPESALFNLKKMADKARARGVGVAHASPIWFNPSVAKDSTTARNSAIRSLRGRILSEASSNGRCFVDAWSKLCPAGGGQQSCFNANYWQPPAGTIDHVGHPNTRGYDVLGGEFFRVLGSKGIPGAAQPIAPTGEACGELLTLTWEKETQANAGCGNWFQIEIDGPGGSKFDGWFPQAGACSGSKCTLTIAANLRREGNHSYRVRTRNTAGYGPWSDDLDFTSIPTAPRQIKKLRGPEGQLFVQGGVLDFKWKPADTTIEYRLEVVSPIDGLVIDEVLAAADACDQTECSFTPEAGLGAGPYTWRVRAENICGGTWSEAALFTLYDSAPPVAPKTATPSARTFDSTPTFRWEPVAGASSYQVEDALGNLVTLTADEACRGDTCRYLSPLLAPGSHSWRVRASNPLGDGVWSAFVPFEVAACNCVEGKAAGGSLYLMAMPENWNGDLVLWAQRSNPFGVREVGELGPLAQAQFDEGYALAATSFTVTGWPVFRSERDLAKLFSIFVRRFSRPTNVYVVGESAGALAAVTALDKAKIGNVIGALPMCGPLAGFRNFEASLDLRLAYDAICAGVPGAELPGAEKGLPADSALTPADVAAAVNFCTGVDRKKVDRTQEEKQRLGDLLDAAGLTEDGLQQAMRQATFGLADLVHDKKKLRGGVPVGNQDVDYGSVDLDAAIVRVKPDGSAERKLEALDFNGKTGETRILTIHTSLDPVSFVENERDFADLIETPDNLLTSLVDENEPSHCGFTPAEELAAWRTLALWAEGGRKPQARNLQRRCKQLQSVAQGPCRFVNRPKIEPLDTRIRERPE